MPVKKKSVDPLPGGGTKARTLLTPTLVELIAQWEADKALLATALASEADASEAYLLANAGKRSADMAFADAGDNLEAAKTNVATARAVLDTDMQAVLNKILAGG